MKRILCLLMISGLMLAGCSSQKGEAVMKAVAGAAGLESSPTTQDEFTVLRTQLDDAEKIIADHFRQMARDDRVNLGVVRSNVRRAEANFAASIDPKTGAIIDMPRLRSAIQAGVVAYQSAKPILLSNKALFGPAEWASLVDFEHSLRRLYESAQVQQDVEKLKAAAKIIGRVVKVAAKVVL